MNARQTAADLLIKLEAIIKKVARALPSGHDGDLLSLLKPILGGISPKNATLRQAFGFPATVAASRNLASVLSSSELSFRPIISIYAQRIYQFLWRCEYTVKEIDADWREEALSKIGFLSQLCEPYLLNQRPTLVDLSSALQHKANLGRFSESAADPTLFAVLRAFDYAEAGITVSENTKQQMKANALSFIYDYLMAVVTEGKRIDDSSNVWWALRLGLESDDTRFDELVEKLLNLFSKPVVPSVEVKNLSLVPEIYTELRTSAYTLTSLQAILEAKIKLDKGLRSRLRTLIDNAVQKLVKTQPSLNLYLACVHYEGLRGYLDCIEQEYIASKMKGSILKLSDFKPVGQFVCGDETLDSQIREVVTWLKPKSTRKKRDSVLVYGASSTGKSFLIEQLFKEFGQESSYVQHRIVCEPSVDVPAVLKNIFDSFSTGSSGAMPPFLFLDEADVVFPKSIFTTVLPLLEGSTLGGSPVTPDSFVLFWAGGKHGSLQAFRTFLVKNQRSKEFEKGFDLFNRGKQLNLPASLIRNKNQKLLLGLAALAKRFDPPFKVDNSVLRSLRNMSMSDKQGARTFTSFAERCQDCDGVVCLKDEEKRGNPIMLEI